MISIHPEVWLNFNHRLKESALVYSGEQGCFQWSAKGRPRLFINILKSQTPKWHNEWCIVSAASTLRQSNQEVSSWGSVKGKLPQIPAVLLWSHFSRGTGGRILHWFSSLWLPRSQCFSAYPSNLSEVCVSPPSREQKSFSLVMFWINALHRIVNSHPETCIWMALVRADSTQLGSRTLQAQPHCIWAGLSMQPSAAPTAVISVEGAVPGSLHCCCTLGNPCISQLPSLAQWLL